MADDATKETLEKNMHYVDIGPDCHSDFRRHRSYFFLPLGPNGLDDHANRVIDRIVKGHRAFDLDYAKATQGGMLPVSDVIVFCHGWHRRAWDAISSYDRIFARLGRMIDQGHVGTGRYRPYHPIYIVCFWESEVGINPWASDFKRRSREDFLQRMREIFIGGYVWWQKDFNWVYSVLTRMVELKEEAFTDEEVGRAANEIPNVLHPYLPPHIRNGHAELFSTLWDCYYATDELRESEPQLRKPGSHVGLFGAFGVINEFLHLTFNGTGKLIIYGFSLTYAFLIIRNLFVYLMNVTNNVIFCLILVVMMFFVPILYLNVIRMIRIRRGRQDKPLNASQNAVLLHVQLITSTPLLIWVFLSFFIGSLWKCMAFTERRGNRDANPNNVSREKAATSISLALSKLARQPFEKMKESTRDISAFGGIIKAFNSQLSFWEMQRKAILVGGSLADALEKIFNDYDELQGGMASGVSYYPPAKLHLIGHSFGSLVASNATRHLAFSKGFKGKVHNLCLLLGAISSDWFKGEVTLLKSIQENLWCVYSKYDTANGFYFPLANQGKLAAGNVGLDLDKQFKAELWEVPSAVVHQFEINRDEESIQQRRVNYDASRLMNRGAAHIGGGHGDLFTDELIYIAWSATVGASIDKNIKDKYK